LEDLSKAMRNWHQMGVVGMTYLVFGLEIREEITKAIRVADAL